MLRTFIAFGSALFALGGLLAPATFAGQDKFTYPPNGGPMQGFEVRGIQTFTGSPGVAYVALRTSGIFKTTDGGDTWAPKYNGINGSAIVRSIFASSTTTLYVATQGDAGIYKSVDGGETWVAKNNGLACHYVRGARLDGANLQAYTSCDTQSGVYQSTDAGETWTRIYTSLPDDFRAWNMFRVSGTEIYVTGNYGIYRSTDNGATFSPANGTGSNVLSSPLSSQIFAFTRRSTGRLVAHADGNGIFYSDNNGLDWFQASGVPANGTSFTGFTVVGTDLYFPFDGAGLYKSTNNGANWFQDTTLAGLPAARTRFFFVDPNTATTRWAATLGGVYKSTDSGANWTKKSSGLPGDVWLVTGHPTDLNMALAISDTVYKSTDKANTWAESSAGLGGHTAFGGTIGSHSAAPDTYYTTTNAQGIYKSTNAGVNWFSANVGIPVTSKPPRNFRVAPSDATFLYATASCNATGAPGGIFKSTNSALSWTDVSSDLTNKCIGSLAIHPTDPNTVYVTTGNALYLGTSGGMYQSSNGNREGGLYKTTNGGASWTFINPGGVQFGVGRPEILTSDPSTLLVTSYNTDNLDRATPLSGAYLSRDGGNSWRQLVSNEKVVQARLVTNPGGRVDAYILTYGYFDEPSNGDIAFKCVDVLNSEVNGNKCSRLSLGAGTRTANTISIRGTSTRISAISTSSGVGFQSYRHLGPDFNNDGLADVLWRHTDGRNHIWNLMQIGDNSNSAALVDPNSSMSVPTVPSPWVVAGLADFNKDGHTDVLWRNTSTGDNYLYLMDNGNVVTEGFLPNVPPPWTISVVGDFDGDGYADIWWNNGPLNYVFMMGIPSGNFPQVMSEGYMPAVYAAGWAIAGTGDFNGDGKSDIWYRNSSSGDNYIYLLNGLTITSEGYTANVPASWTVAGFGDFNGDGNTDVLWREGTYGYNYVYHMSGLAVLGTSGYLPTVSDLSWTVQGTGDTNRDGISDILWRQNSTGYNFVWRMNGNGVQYLCGAQIGGALCTSGPLPMIDEAGWSVVNK